MSNGISPVVLVLLIVWLLYLIFSKKPVNPGARDYAEKARTEPIDASWAGAMSAEFRAGNTVSIVEARKKVATSLAELHKKEGEARKAELENDYQVVRHRLEHELLELQHKNQESRLEEASKHGVAPEIHEQMVVESHHTSEAIRLDREKTDIEINKAKILNEHEVEMDFKKKMNTLAAITRYRHLQFDAFDEVRGRLIALLEEAHRIEMSHMNVYLKGEVMGRMQLAIDTYQEVFDVFRRRLVEEGDGQVIRQINSITDLTGGGESGPEAAPFKLPTAEPGERD